MEIESRKVRAKKFAKMSHNNNDNQFNQLNPEERNRKIFKDNDSCNSSSESFCEKETYEKDNNNSGTNLKRSSTIAKSSLSRSSIRIKSNLATKSSIKIQP